MRTGLWRGIVSGCTVTFNRSGTDQYAGGARYVADGQRDELWDIRDVPTVHAITHAQGHATARIGVRFLGEAEKNVTFNITVRDASGAVLQESRGADIFTLSLKGTKDSGIQRGTLVFLAPVGDSA